MDEAQENNQQEQEIYAQDQNKVTAEEELGQSPDQDSYPIEDENGIYESPPPPPPMSPIERIFALAKRFIIPIILLLLAVLLIVFFIRLLHRGGGTGTNKKANLTYWILWEDDKVYQSIIDSFNKENPNVTITVVKQTPREYRERLENAILRGEGPDIFRFHNTWLPMFFQKQIIAPVPEKVMDKTQFESIFYPVANNDLKIGNAIYGIPLNFDALGMFYNKSILKAAGVKPPATWEELRSVVNELTVRDTNGRITTAGVALGTTNNIEFWSDILGLMILQNSGNITSPKGENAEDAMLFYTRFAQQPDNVWDQTLDNSVLAFAGEKVAMIFGPSWITFEIKALNPNLDFGIAPVPQLPGVNIAWASYWVEGVSKKSENQEIAFSFLKYLSEKENVTQLYTEEAKTRLFGEPYARIDLAESLKGDQYLDAIVTQGPYARSGYLSSKTYDNGLNDRIIKYYENAVNGIHEGKSPRTALDTASRGITQVLTDFGLTSSQ